VWYQALGPNYVFTQTQFGQAGDVVAPADFDGDTITDIAIFRGSTGEWWYRGSSDGLAHRVLSGASIGDVPRPGDVNGDGFADFVNVHTTSQGMVWIRLINGSFVASDVGFGLPGDQPLLADFDGDGRVDPAIFRPSTGTFWYAASASGGVHTAVRWGVASDVPVPADYDGDGTTDFAVYRPSDRFWYILNSRDGSATFVQFGLSDDKPIPADYDGDRRADIAVYRPSTGTWYLLRSTAGFGGFQFGVSTDIPSPAAYLPEYQP
jgi:hypothetical protein